MELKYTFYVFNSCPEGVEKCKTQMYIYIAALDEKLNDKAYITPGLGAGIDYSVLNNRFGDRYFDEKSYDHIWN